MKRATKIVIGIAAVILVLTVLSAVRMSEIERGRELCRNLDGVLVESGGGDWICIDKDAVIDLHG